MEWRVGATGGGRPGRLAKKAGGDTAGARAHRTRDRIGLVDLGQDALGPDHQEGGRDTVAEQERREEQKQHSYG